MSRYPSEQTRFAHGPLLSACFALEPAWPPLSVTHCARTADAREKHGGSPLSGADTKLPGGAGHFHLPSIRVFILLLFFLLSIIPAGSAAAADSYQVGFRTLGQWSADTGLRLDVNIWYPSIRPPRELNYAPWTIAAARNGKPVEGRFPLLLLSHASPGTRFSYHDTAAWLASCGFVVAAPTHSQDCMDDMSLLFTWRQIGTRAKELSSTIDLLLADQEVAASIDKNRIGLLGFGTGGTAALLLGGALPDCASWPEYCAKAGRRDMYCNRWARDRVNAICQSLPLTKSLADPRIKAVAAAAPGFGMLFSSASFRYFYPPLLLIAAESDTMNRPALHADAIARLLNGKARYLSLPGADTGALMSPCPEALAAELPELCRSVSTEERRAIHRRMDDALSDFFLHVLGSGKNLPVIPPPPDLTPPPPPEPQLPAPAPRPRQRRSR